MMKPQIQKINDHLLSYLFIFFKAFNTLFFLHLLLVYSLTSAAILLSSQLSVLVFLDTNLSIKPFFRDLRSRTFYLDFYLNFVTLSFICFSFECNCFFDFLRVCAVFGGIILIIIFNGLIYKKKAKNINQSNTTCINKT